MKELDGQKEKTIFGYFIECMTNKYFCFQGRARRKEYFGFLFCANIIANIIGFNAKSLGLEPESIKVLYILIFILPYSAVLVRRLHDVNFSGWWVLTPLFLGIIAAAGAIADYAGNSNFLDTKALVYDLANLLVIPWFISLGVIFIVSFCESNKKPNKYGEVPAGILHENTSAHQSLSKECKSLMQDVNSSEEVDLPMNGLICLRWVFMQLEKMFRFLIEKSFPLLVNQKILIFLLIYTLMISFLYDVLFIKNKMGDTNILMIPYILYICLPLIGIFSFILVWPISYMYGVLSYIHIKIYPENYIKNIPYWSYSYFLHDKIEYVKEKNFKIMRKYYK